MSSRKRITGERPAGRDAAAGLLTLLIALALTAASCRWTTPNQGASQDSGSAPSAEPAAARDEISPDASSATATGSEPAPAASLAETPPAEAPSPPPAAAGRGLVCLDPGHADTPYEIDPDTGLNTSDWANEPEIGIVWDIAERAAALLQAQGVQVVLTKSSCYDPVNLKQRAVIANSAGAALIVHIHSDPGISAPTTFYPGAAPYNWKANSDSGRTAYISPAVQQASGAWASAFHSAMAAYLAGMLGVGDGGLAMENRGSTGTGNYGPLLSYDVWSRIPTFTLENNQSFADAHRQPVAESIAAGVLACLNSF